MKIFKNKESNQLHDWYLETEWESKLIKINEKIREYDLPSINRVKNYTTATLVCNPKDWHIDIELPLNKEK